jgi:predicted Fe-Mo cluster-binding NifX family protein
MEKVAISANGESLEARVDPRFGRASYFLLVNPATMEFEAVANRQNLQAVQGAGLKAAALVADRQPAAILTGNCGPKAFQILEAAGIPVFLGVTGSVREAVEQFRTGKLLPARAPNASGHWL